MTGFQVEPAQVDAAAGQVGALAAPLSAGAAALAAAVEAATAGNIGYETSTALGSLSAAVDKVTQQYADSFAQQSQALTETSTAYQQNDEQARQLFQRAV